MKRLGAVMLVALAAAGCGGHAQRASQQVPTDDPGGPCVGAKLGGWQKLARRIHAPVYCPNWLPDPLDGIIGSRWNNIDVVSRDRSYLESWVWQETGAGAAGGELHVNLRGYPGRTAIPKCFDDDTSKRTVVPCFADSRGTVREHGISATVFTVNQDADQWHILYAWRSGGSLYTISEHVAPPLDYAKVRLYLDHILQGLVLVQPS
jgi:hypothetical protein